MSEEPIEQERLNYRNSLNPNDLPAELFVLADSESVFRCLSNSHSSRNDDHSATFLVRHRVENEPDRASAGEARAPRPKMGLSSSPSRTVDRHHGRRIRGSMSALHGRGSPMKSSSGSASTLPSNSCGETTARLPKGSMGSPALQASVSGIPKQTPSVICRKQTQQRWLR